MSLRIQNDAVTSGPSPEVSRPDQTNSLTSGTGKFRGAAGTEGGDRVEVSSVAESISAGISAQNQQRAARVAELSGLYASGGYSVDSAQVSRSIVNSAITGSSVAGNA